MFDVDKLYLSTMSYKNGELEEVGDDLLKSSKGAIANRLIQNYIDVVTDIKNRANARASIDVVTGIIQNSTLPAIRGKQNTYRDSMYELTPYFQLRRKQEFSIGKAGIGPFALNITNLALTLFAHISMDFSALPFKMGALDEIVGEDGIRISDWLSAMVNAHVDVAKDPYVFDLNINSLTYNYANLLLRAGKGESTFLFLAQPALKRYAAEFNNAGGLYGSNLKNQPQQTAKSLLLKKYIKEYTSLLQSEISKITDKEKKKSWTTAFNNLVSGEESVDWNIVFDKDAAKGALRNPNSLRGIYFQIMSLKVLEMLQPYADEISALVMNSRIDTKKFGNTIALQRDFLNEYKKFKYEERGVSWYCTDVSNERALNRYFESTFLESKLYAATGLVRDILSTQMFTASKLFDDMMYTMMGEIYGFVEVVDDNQNKLHLYERVYDKKVVQAVSDAAENVIRQKMLLFYGAPKAIDDSYDYRRVEKENGYSGPIDFTFGGHIEDLHKELRRLYFGDPTSEDFYDQNSIFKNIASVIQLLENSSIEDRTGRFAGLVNTEGRVVNELLNYLRPQPADGRISIPRLLLKKTNRNTTMHEKNKLISAFDFLLKSNVPGIRRLARDIAVFSYYSTYNTNKYNTFFDLVPAEYRKQYDDALSKGVKRQNDVSSIVMINDDGSSVNTAVECKQMLDAIGRNFYDDSNIVPEYSLDKSNKKKQGRAGFGPGEHVGPGVVSIAAKSSIPSCFLTTKNNKPYLKMTIGGQTFLYQKRGFVSTVSHVSREERGYRWYAYALVPKLGIHEGTFNLYELSNSTNDPSIFRQNQLPERYSLDMASGTIVKFMKDSQDAINKQFAKDKKKGDPQDVMWTRYDDLSIEQQPAVSIHKILDNSMSKNNVSVEVENPQEYIENNTDFVIDLEEPINDLILMLNLNNQFSAEKDGVSIGFVGEIPGDDKESVVIDIYQTIQSTNANINDMYFENTESGKLAYKIYNDNNSFDFAETSSVVSKKEVSPQEIQLEKPAELSEEEKSQLEGAKQLDEVLDRPVEVKPAQFIADDEISDSKFRGVTPEMIEELKRRKMLQQAAINRESNNSEENKGC